MRPNLNLPPAATADLKTHFGGLPDRVTVPHAGPRTRQVSPCPTIIRGRPCGKTTVFLHEGRWRCPRCGSEFSDTTREVLTIQHQEPI